MGFQALLARLLEIAGRRIRCGELSERGLARLASLSQPYVHKVLKGEKNPTHISADRLLFALGLMAADLLTPAEIQGMLERAHEGSLSQACGKD